LAGKADGHAFRSICGFGHFSATSVGQSANMNSTIGAPGAAQAEDRFLAWPFFATIGPAILFGLAFGFAPVLVVNAMSFLVAATGVLAFVALVMTVHSVREHKWRKAVSTLVMLAYLALIPLAPRISIGPFVGLGIWAHFLSEYNSYEAEIATLPTDAPRFRIFDWGGFAGVNEFIVYDETDQKDPGVCDGPASHMMGHYYFC
jgi:hypothetical protein